MAGARAVCLLAAAVFVAAALAAGAPQAHATPPAIPCGYECRWPAGTYSIPERVEDGGEFEISWSYTWDPQDALAVAAGAKGAPDGHYAVPGGAADVPPPGYGGSVVTLRLPQELKIVGWEGKGLKRERLWTDHYDRTMYEYTWANGYAETGTHDRSITVRLSADGMFYRVTELVVDLGLSVADSPPRSLFAIKDAGGAALSAEPPGVTGASGAADKYPHRQSLKWPLPEVSEAALPAGVVGAAGDDETYVYGYFYKAHEDPAGDVRACLYDRGDGDAMTMITRNGEAACTQTSHDGFWSLVIPREDPDGDDTDADVTVRFSLEGEGATVMNRMGEVYAEYRRDRTGSLSSELNLGTHIALGLEFDRALSAYKTINDARAYFLETFSYEVPHVDVREGGGGGQYRISDGTILVSTFSHTVDSSTIRHEYGHHIMAQTVGIPPTTSCNPHYFNRASSESCAWSEGWANFVSSLVANSHVTSRASVSFDAEVPGTNEDFGLYEAEHGPDVEARVTGVLWDIHDSGTGEAHDDIHGGAQLIWDVLLDEREAGERYPAASIHDFRDDWEDAGYPSLDGVFRQNGFLVGGGATMSVLDSNDNAKTGAGRAHAKAGEAVRVTVALDAAVGAAPAISFYDGTAAPMSPGGAPGLWRAEHAVTSSTREGLVSFAVNTGNEVVATLHDVNAGGRAVVDRTAPRALSAEFVAPGTIEVEFSEPVVLPGGGAFSVTPPGGGGAPSVSASLSEDGTVATLALSPEASADGDWSVSVPATLADPAGNSHGARSVTAGFLADSDPPTFTARRVSATQIEVQFNEDIRPAREGGRLPNFTLTSGSKTIEVERVLVDFPNNRLTLWFGVDVFAGTLTHRRPDGALSFEDLLGNAVEDGKSAEVSETITPVFHITSINMLDTSSPTPPVVVLFTVPVDGTLSVSDWRVNGKQPEYFSSGPASRFDLRSSPFTEGAFAGFQTFHMHVDAPACDGSVRVDYVAPGSGSLVARGGGAKVPSMEASSPCNYLTPHKAVFLDSRTLSVTFDRVPGALDLDSFLVDGLGTVLGHQEHGSRAVTLHVRNAAADGDTHVVTNNDIRDTAAGRPGVLPVLMSAKATYKDKTAPTVTAEYGRVVSGATHVKLYLSEPLDAGTLAGKVFAASGNPSPTRYTGGFSAHYLPGERVVYLIPDGEFGGRVARVSVPAGIADVNGVGLAALDVGAGNYQRPTTPVVTEHAVTVTLPAPLSEESLKHVWISPPVGVLEVSQSGRKLTITAEGHFRHDARYEVVVPHEAENVNGRKVEPRGDGPRLKFYYTDTSAPTATARFVTPQEIAVALSEPLDAYTVTRAAFSVTPPLGPLGVEYADGGLEVLLRTPEPARPGTEYTVGVSGAKDFAGLALSPSTLRVSHGASALLTGAAFTSPDTIEVAASAPLDPGTLGGIGVSGLGRATAEYDGASRVVTLKTARAAEEGATHRVFVPGTVLGADGAPAGPVVLEATSDFGRSRPAAVSAQTPLYGHVAVHFDRHVGPAAGSPGSLDASRWTVALAGDKTITARSAVAVGRVVWLQYGGEGDADLDRIRRLSSIYMDAWSPRAAAGAALAVSYAPGGGAGDVADRTTARNPLEAVSLPVEDRLPPTFTARTARGATIVAFDRAVSGATSAADWLVAGEPAAGVSALDPGANIPASGSALAALPEGTTRIALHRAQAAPDGEPLVSYAPRGTAAAVLSGGIPMAPWIARATDGTGPRAVDAAFTGPRMLHVAFDEAPKTASVSEAAFSVTGSTGTVSVTSADHTPHSRTVSLGLGSGAAAGAYSVKVTDAVTDAHGNPVDGGGPAVSAKYAPAAQGEPTISARAVSGGVVDVTFDPAVSGTTSKDAWEVGGSAVGRIIAVGGRSVPDNLREGSVTLPEGTKTIRLVAPALGSGSADEPIVRHVGQGIAAGEVHLGARAAKASDGKPVVLSWVGGGDTARLGFSEPILFSGGDASARDGHWFGLAPGDSAHVPVTVSTDGDSALVIRAEKAIAKVGYDSRETDGAVVDASGNFLLAGIQFVGGGPQVGPDLDVRGDPGGSGVSVRVGGRVLVLPGVPVFVFSGSDGDRVGTWQPRDLTTLSVDVAPPLAAGDTYEVAFPSLSDRRGITHGETQRFVYGSDSDPPAVESARFAGPREVRVVFGEPLRAVPTSAAFSVTPTSGTAIPLEANGVSHEAGLRTVTLSLSKDASPGVHEVRVPAAVSDLAGNAYVAPAMEVTATYDAVAPTASSATFTGERSVSLMVSEPLDAATVGMIRVRGLGATSSSYAAGSTVTLHTQLPAAAGSSHAVVIPAGVTDANGVPFAPTTLWAARSDMSPPTALGARTVSLTTTEVDFGEAVRLGPSPTTEQHAAHWAVTEAGVSRAVTGAEVVRGGLSVRLTHAPIGASAMPSVSYVKGTNDDASVRDWASGPNYMESTMMAVDAGDGLPPSIDSLTMSVSRPGDAGGTDRMWARAGDTVRFAMSMSEAAGTSAPTIRLAGMSHEMAASGDGRRAWTHDHMVPDMDAAQGSLAFVVSASDGGGNAAYAEVPTSGIVAMVDTILPKFTARTLGAGLVEVTFSEPVRGIISASEWVVGGAAGTAVAASADSAPAATVALDRGARFVLWHGEAGTGGEPVVSYDPAAA